MTDSLNYAEQIEVKEALEEFMDCPVPYHVSPSYMFGLWLERRFRVLRGWDVDWQLLHKYAKEFCKERGLD